MGRSQVLYNQRAGRSRAPRGGSAAGRGSDGRGGGRVRHRDDAVPSDAAVGPIHLVPMNAPWEPSRSSERDHVGTSISASDMEADHLLSLASTTSIYTSQRPVSAHEANAAPSFLHTSGFVTTATTQAQCSRMGRILETLPRSQQWRMPSHLLETMYGAEIAQVAKAPSSPRSQTSKIGPVVETSAPLSGPTPPVAATTTALSQPWLDVTDLTATVLDDDSDFQNDKSEVVYLGTKHSNRTVNEATQVDHADEDDLDSWLDTVIS